MRGPLVAEVAGVAGAGKSTLARAVAALDPAIRARPAVPAAAYLAYAVPLIPMLVGLHRPFQGVLRKEIKRVVRLRALQRLAHRAPPGATILFDEGPVYLLARILVYGGRGIQTQAFARWWARAIAEWAATLDVIVWVDAPDAILMARIRTRPQLHPQRDAATPDLARFLEAYRTAYDRVIRELTAVRDLPVWRIRTDFATSDELAAELRQQLSLLRPAPSGARIPA